jgi:hypothetical protein
MHFLAVTLSFKNRQFLVNTLLLGDIAPYLTELINDNILRTCAYTRIVLNRGSIDNLSAN